MSVDLIGLAFDCKSADDLWSRVSIAEAFFMVLSDPFRKRVDYRSIFFRQNNIALLSDINYLLKRGGEKFSVMSYCAAQFSTGTEDLPFRKSDFDFDYNVIRFYSSLALVEDFLKADALYREVISDIPGDGSSEYARWLVDNSDYVWFYQMLDAKKSSQTQDIGLNDESRSNTMKLRKSMMEFFAYCYNNHFLPFLYNSETPMDRRKLLLERQSTRNSEIVDLSFREKFLVTSPRKNFCLQRPHALKEDPSTSLEDRFRKRREIELLREGLNDPDAIVRQKSAEALTEKDSDSYFEIISEKINDLEPFVRMELLRGMQHMNDRSSQDLLVHIMKSDESLGVRNMAAYVLACRENETGLLEIMAEISERNPFFSTIAAFHSLMGKSERAHKKIEKMCENTSHAFEAREAVFLLGKIYRDTAKKALHHVFNTANQESREIAFYALWSQKDRSLKKLLDAGSQADLQIKKFKSWLKTPGLNHLNRSGK